MKAALVQLAVALALALGSCVVPRTVVEFVPGSEDCAQGCTVVAAGWPLPWLVDHHGTSPHGSVSLTGGLLGVDHIRLPELALTALFWLAATLGAGYAVRRRGRQRP